jgi:hypothetical protein
MRRSVQRILPLSLVVTMLLGVAVVATAEPPEHVTVCHRTGSSVNPFVTIHPSSNGAYHGHLQHSGDVIPPFGYQGQTYSLNWPSDQVDVIDGECVAAAPPDEEPPEDHHHHHDSGEPDEVLPKPPIHNEPTFTG